MLEKNRSVDILYDSFQDRRIPRTASKEGKKKISDSVSDDDIVCNDVANALALEAAELAQHKHHHTTLRPREGTGGRERSP